MKKDGLKVHNLGFRQSAWSIVMLAFVVAA